MNYINWKTEFKNIDSSDTGKIFHALSEKYIKLDGNDAMLAALGRTDFYIAPASTRFHLSREGGLCEHSLNVFSELTRLLSVYDKDETISESSAAICGLYHDVCKINYYDVSTRNVKNDKTGAWEKQPFYTVNDKLPMGHGEKSMYMVMRCMHLSPEEAMAIRWHMGGYDEAVKGGSYAQSAAYDKYPLALLLHLADMAATHMSEVE